MEYPTSVTLTLPAWLHDMMARPLLLPDPKPGCWVIGLSRLNVERRSGGSRPPPFERETGRLAPASIASNC
jgi:hypothetical protein